MRVIKFIFISLLLCSLSVVLGCGKSATDPAEGDGNPWGGVVSGNTPIIEMLDLSDCKQTPTGIPNESAQPDQDCIEYWYVGGSELNIKHINAGFNCCPIVDVDIRIEGDTITIEEIEIEGQCACLCLFDVDYQIQDLAPGIYHLRVIEPYRPDGDPVLEFTMDLIHSPSGRHCVFRSQYPWGYPW